MSEEKTPSKPYKSLGSHLKYLREQSNQTIAEVSGSVEIDDAALERIEDGIECPSEDILLLLINHFQMKDGEATQLWELAGYDAPFDDDKTDADGNAKQVIMLLAMDPRTVYSDGVEITANQAGITMSFTQASGKPQPTTVARLGMSYEQAARVAQTIQTVLLQAKYLNGPKQLPPATEDLSGKS